VAPLPSRTRAWRQLVAAAVLAGSWTAPAAAQHAVVHGVVRYEKIPATPAGLRPEASAPAAAGRIHVEVIDAHDARVLASAFTDEKGRFRLAVPLEAPADAFLRAVARTDNAAVVRVEDRVPFTADGPVRTLRPGASVEETLLVTEERRIAGAFNIAVVVGRANALIRGIDADLPLLDVEIRWDTAYADGTFFRERDRAAYINGDRRRDSDEFDDHVIVHEYAHFLMAALSRESSPGGSHGDGDPLDPRLAWSEGWANFFAAAVLDDPRYIDTGAREGRQLARVTMDLAEPVLRRDRPGIWSEHSVGSALWSWHAGSGLGEHGGGLGFRPLWEAFLALRKVPDAHLVPFVDSLAVRVKDQRRLVAVLRAREIEHVPGAPQLWPAPITPGVPVRGSVDSRSTLRSNVWGASSHYAFTVDVAGPVSIRLDIVAAEDRRRADLDLFLFDADGEEVGRSIADNGVGGTEAIVRTLAPGYYRIEVRSWSGASGGRLTASGAHQGSYTLLLKR
jgi:hypothetical protein